MKFRKKPVVIEAEQFTGDVMPALCARSSYVQFHGSSDGIHSWLSIDTLEGTMMADPGDWIIQGIKGELYPCKPDIFEATYEAVAE